MNQWILNKNQIGDFESKVKIVEIDFLSKLETLNIRDEDTLKKRRANKSGEAR